MRSNYDSACAGRVKSGYPRYARCQFRHDATVTPWAAVSASICGWPPTVADIAEQGTAPDATAAATDAGIIRVN
ncbi:hypothetical protein KIF59_15520 [Enterobacter cloacae subsp. cloacae]|nr:hypothetical protein [Enterobacter cloacae subsp. cloacae]